MPRMSIVSGGHHQEKTGLYRLLEDGASGLMIPHVANAEQASFLVQAMKFPPQGDRGFDGAGRDTGFLFRHR